MGVGQVGGEAGGFCRSVGMRLWLHVASDIRICLPIAPLMFARLGVRVRMR